MPTPKRARATAPADAPIPFSAPMIRALIEGRKTQTRRIISRLNGKGAVTEFGPSTTSGYDWHFRDKRMLWQRVRDSRLRELLPWRVGRRLWVRETFKLHSTFNDLKPSEAPRSRVFYLADLAYSPSGSRVHSPIHIPRWASRLTLIVEDVRVRQLQEIGEEDAKAEGLACLSKDLGRVWKWGLPESDGLPGPSAWEWQMWCVGHRPAYAKLWNSLHGPDAWSANPWIAALTFRVIRANIDAPEARAA